MFEASDFSSRSSFFVVLGKCKHSPQQQKRLGLRPLALICAIRSMVYGVAGIERYYTFKGIPASPALRLAVEYACGLILYGKKKSEVFHFALNKMD